MTTYPGVLLKSSSLFAKKELGQNFLADPQAAAMIVQRAGIKKEDTVLEIGPGLGALTVHIARQAHKVYAVEKDTRLIPLITGELEQEGVDNVTLINKDIFKVDIRQLAGDGKLLVIGNLPYNISSQVLFQLVENRDVVPRAILMFQKELAQRIVAPPGGRDYGRLSVVMQYCSRVSTVTDVGGQLFFPKPEVESRVVAVDFFDTIQFPQDQEKYLFRVVKAAFSKRRKTLRNSLAGAELGINTTQAAQALEGAGIDPVRRAETLTVEEFIALFKVCRDSFI
ncbi:dimethyladenosine transferase [Desulfocicer vacuolatum DSM 3385]|uniref:Ribosomal RNA small subunit methyltransferase A n=1 Tax=Desulfocicer vacuolatum DSM 3385 TaxID=1121400 RepID=A0A1W2A605_9BACT|nr:16S rRNA (adenine(1518)-N(6)/adenine(1519)-N(6))-dimethyltransferase RsmA [Desulfocicer vacuolatum]SMC56066.1 dimethyladenosine transferase [Desulfocicer vacuolatum DSM 3385]